MLNNFNTNDQNWQGHVESNRNGKWKIFGVLTIDYLTSLWDDTVRIANKARNVGIITTHLIGALDDNDLLSV